MKNSNIHNLALMLMVVMVYSAPPSYFQKHLPDNEVLLLKKIKEKADTLPVNSDIKMRNISQEDNPCPDHFFCLAERAMKCAGHAKPEQNFLLHSALTHSLHVYNKEIQDENCPLNTHRDEYSLTLFVDNIKTCVDYTLMNKTIT